MSKLSLALRPLKQNLDLALNFCRQRNLALLPVTKIVQSRADILEWVHHPALAALADVHPENLARLDPRRVRERVVLRPRFSDAPAVARHATRVFLSDPSLARRLGEARQASRIREPLGVNVMVEDGDLRDGVPWSQLAVVLKAVAAETSLDLRGLAVNMGCLAGAVPDANTLNRLAEGLVRMRKLTGLPLPEFSVGGTVFWDALQAHGVPPEITEFRLGEAFFFGWNTSLGQPIEGLSRDVFELSLEVLEVWTKTVTAQPSGFAGFDAFGRRPVHQFLGERRRAVLDGGESHAPMSHLEPLDFGYTLVGQTHEYTVVDCHESPRDVVPGSLLRFRPRYEAVARSFLSPFLDLSIGELV